MAQLLHLAALEQAGLMVAAVADLVAPVIPEVMAQLVLFVLSGVEAEHSHQAMRAILRKMMNALVLAIGRRLGVLGKCQRRVQVRQVEMGGRRI